MNKLMPHVQPWQVVFIFLLGYLSLIYAIRDEMYGDGLRTFVTLGECYASCSGQAQCVVPPNASHYEFEGYDGQFSYYIAKSPTNAAPCLDVPAYRYQRILLPLLGYVFSFGQASLIPIVFLFFNMSALVLGTYLLERLLYQWEKSPWFALAYGMFGGVFLGVRLSTSEPLAYGLVILAIWAYEHQRNTLMIAALCLAALTKETTLVLTGGFILWFIYERDWKQLAWIIIGVGIPFGVWQGLLYAWLGALGVGAGGAGATNFEIVPFYGVLRLWTDGNLTLFLAQGLWFMGFVVVVPVMWGIFSTITDFYEKTLSLYSCLLLSAALIMPFVPFSTYREYLGILRFLPPLVLTILLYSAFHQKERVLRYNMGYLFLLVFLVVI